MMSKHQLLIPVTTLLLLFISSYSNTADEDGNKFSQTELEAIEKFRLMVQDVLNNDHQKLNSYLIRWLRARDMDLVEAEKMLRKAHQWRKDNRIDDILKEVIFDDLNFLKAEGFDYIGRPVMTLSISKLDLRKIVVAGKKDMLVRYAVQNLEKMALIAREASKHSGKDISQIVVLNDFSSFSQRQHSCAQCIQYAMDLTKIYESYYPGFRKWDVIINAPKSYALVLERTKFLLSPETMKSTKIFGADKNEWSAFLDKIIPADQRTFQFGGTKKINTTISLT